MSTPAVQFPPEPPPVDRPRAKILIVDDDERNAFAACQALEALGQDLVVARSGPEALRKLLTTTSRSSCWTCTCRAWTATRRPP
jgi:PleD family two-component response regulator